MTVPLPVACTTRRALEEAGYFTCLLDEGGRVMMANAPARALSRVQELIGRNFLENLNSFPCPVPHVPAGITKAVSALLDGTTDSFSQEYVCPLGDARTCSVRGFRMVNATHSGVLVVQEDITEERARETRAQDAQRLAGIGLLAGGIAHDFNNLLTAIRGSAEILELEQGDLDAVASEVAEIKAAADRGAALTHQLLAFARRQPGRVRSIDLNRVVGELCPMLSRLLGEDAQLRLELDPEIVPVMADPGQLEQVIMNLVMNARDAMPAGGLITVSTRNLSASEAPADQAGPWSEGDRVQIMVTDSGTGMPPEVRERLFEPFFTTKKPGKGTGLGLPTVQGIVRQHGGTVVVTSAEGVGTSVSISLPRTDRPLADPHVAGAPPRSLGGSETVLLVEDDDSVRRVVRRILERSGYTVLEAASPGEAIALADAGAGRIDLCLADVVMPEMSGVELAGQLRHVMPALPVLLMSGFTRDELDRHAMIEQNLPFVPKPFSTVDFLSAVRDALETEESVET
jgi:two-component system, cell cycle sensor histidine kinase and response regulator CckA